MLDWLRRTFLPLKRTDPRFGPIRFQRMRGDASYWEGSGTFAGEEVEYFVDAGEDGPTPEQRALADDLEGRWSTLEPLFERLLARHEREARENGVSTRIADWSLGSISIPDAKDRAGNVEVGYAHRPDGELMTFELDARGTAPQAVRFGS